MLSLACCMGARTVREKLLKKHFFFHESAAKSGPEAALGMELGM